MRISWAVLGLSAKLGAHALAAPTLDKLPVEMPPARAPLTFVLCTPDGGYETLVSVANANLLRASAIEKHLSARNFADMGPADSGSYSLLVVPNVSERLCLPPMPVLVDGPQIGEITDVSVPSPNVATVLALSGAVLMTRAGTRRVPCLEH